ncbi:MAG: hypothetical protein N2556_09350 [Anaerolineae bacterium]|nr:hypothetical protein [Anaerolineae bacterium]MDW8069790.1 hypothetical protein [Anaerolineae bacterium]
MNVTKISVYLNDPVLREKVKSAATRRGVSISTYVLQALRDRLAWDEMLLEEISPQEAAKALDALRTQIGPIGIPVRMLVEEGRYR